MRRTRSRRYSRLEPLQAGASDGSRGYASTPAHGVIASPLHLASIRLRSARDRGSGTLLGSKSPVRYPMDA